MYLDTPPRWNCFRLGVDRALIAIWLGHESVETTQIYLDANLTLKEEILGKTRRFNHAWALPSWGSPAQLSQRNCKWSTDMKHRWPPRPTMLPIRDGRRKGPNGGHTTFRELRRTAPWLSSTDHRATGANFTRILSIGSASVSLPALGPLSNSNESIRYGIPSGSSSDVPFIT